MKDDINRHVPYYPEIREDGITPAGYGGTKGNQPCFCTRIGYIDIYLPHLMVTELQIAKEIFEGLEPEVLKIVRYGPHDRSASIMVRGELCHFWLAFYFGAIIPEELDQPPVITSITRYFGQELAPS